MNTYKLLINCICLFSWGPNCATQPLSQISVDIREARTYTNAHTDTYAHAQSHTYCAHTLLSTAVSDLLESTLMKINS